MPVSQRLMPKQLRCEYRVDPSGIDVAAPRLSWTLRSSERGQRQTGYRILVASSRRLLAKNTSDLWDSGMVISDESIQIAYAGKPEMVPKQEKGKKLLGDPVEGKREGYPLREEVT